MPSLAHSPVGAPFEGLAKSNYCAYYNVPLAKRGVELFATSSAYNFAALFHLNILLPSGRAFIYETGIGPMSTWSPDAEMFKMAYPTDAAIDIVFRCGTGMAYRPVKEYRGEPAGDGERELESYRREIFARNAHVNLERLYRRVRILKASQSEAVLQLTCSLPKRTKLGQQQYSSETEMRACETEMRSCETEMRSCETEMRSCETDMRSSETEMHSSETEMRACETKMRSCETEMPM